MSLEASETPRTQCQRAIELERAVRQSVTPQTVLLWCDLTFKLEHPTRRKRVRQPARSPFVRNKRVINPVEPSIRTWEIASVDDSNVLSVRPTPRNRPLPLKLAARYAVRGTRRNYLSEPERDVSNHRGPERGAPSLQARRPFAYFRAFGSIGFALRGLPWPVFGRQCS